MNFKNDEFKILIDTFTRIEKEINEEVTHNNRGDIQRRESEILGAYNKIIHYAHPIWENTNKKLRASVRSTLINIYNRLENSLDLLESNIELPKHLNETVTNNEVKSTNSKIINNSKMTTHEDIVPRIANGDQIQLESYRSIPEFSGNKNEYRSWRNQAVRRMNMIKEFKTHPKYEAALGIIRAKITGPASNVLTNYKTAYNFTAIIERLDTAYEDQRPLYIIEAELTSIKQMNKTLREYFEEINQALQSVISKITFAYKNVNEQDALINEARQKAVRTFITGLRSQASRTILYSQNPKTVEEAYTTAQTVYYNDQYFHLDQHRESQRREQQKNQLRPQRQFFLNPNMQPTRNFPAGPNMNVNYNQPQQQFQPKNKQEKMNMETSNHFKQTTDWQRPNTQMNGQQREYNYSRQHAQQPHKTQRINQIHDEEMDANDGCKDDICDQIPDDLISNSSHGTNETTTSSAFLDE